ncbi:hypothetical protein V4R08_04620 [Nitrobacter sp. NHB1]|uniref:hypothetical protein n=1 Tax=Nitrobacter sp. NHB1 TaxID=3119830 RepID=UPI002FFD6CE9
MRKLHALVSAFCCPMASHIKMELAVAKSLDLQNRLAVSVSEFCRLTGSSKSYFYSLPDNERPKMVKRGGRFFIPIGEVHRFVGEVAA